MVIESLGVYLPERVVSTAEVVAACAVPLRLPLERLTGIRTRRVAAPDEGCPEIARAAIADCLARSGHTAQAIDLLICASISNHGAGQSYCCEPSLATRLKAVCGFDRAIAFDVSNGCAGAWTAILVAESMIGAGLIARAMVVSGEFITELIGTAQREIVGYLDPQVSSLTVGDSGIAVTLEATDDPEAGFDFLDLYTLGAYSRYCVTSPSTGPHGSYAMRNDTLRLGARSIEHVASHLSDTLRTARWSPRDVALLVPHQTSEFTLLDGLKRLNERLDGDGFTSSQYVINLAERGNTATTTHFVAIRDLVDDGRLQNGDRVAFCITGSGLSIGTALYTFDDLPDRLRREAPSPRQRAASTGANAATPRGLQPPVAGIAGVGLARGVEAASLDSEELCRRAGGDCLRRAGRAPEDVELLIHTGTYKTDFVPEPATAAFAANALGTNASAPPGAGPRTLTFDLMAGPLGTLKACWVADQLIRTGRYQNALILASEVENHADQPEYGIHGLEPAGSALFVVRRNEGPRFEHFHFRDFPEHAAEFEAYMQNPAGRPRLVVRRDPRFEAHMACCLTVTVRDLLASLDMALDDFDAVVMPAGLPGLTTRLVEALGIREGQVAPVQASGDLLGSAVAAGLAALEDAGRATAGSRVLVLAAGAGIQTGCAILRL